MITLDGAFGEGGGQILRSALALSVLTQQPFRLTHIRANRKTPGLRRQHLTALHAATTICNAAIAGDHVGSSEITFKPAAISPGNYLFDVGTAGSTALVLQTILPPLFHSPQPSRITIKGGTHNPFAPPFPFLEHTFVPILKKMGFALQLDLKRPGFFPAGGGTIVASIKPSSMYQALSLLERGRFLSTSAIALSSNLPEDITRREISHLSKILNDPKILYSEQNIHSAGPGNVMWLSVAYENITETFTGFGQKGKSVQIVVGELLKEYNDYKTTAAPVGPHLADQLLIPMVMAGVGDFITTELTSHTTTNIEVIRRFVDYRINVEELPGGAVLIRVSKR